MRRIAPLLALALGCAKATVSARDFPALFARAVCEVQMTCRGEATFLEQQCEADSGALFAPDLDKALAAKKAVFDPGQAQACLDGLRARGCDRTPPEVDQACERAVTGTLQKGQPCSWIFECAQGRCEPALAGGCPASCGTAAGEGQSCADSPCDLRAGLRCIENVCSRLHAPGGKCSSDSDCAPGLYCDGFDKCSTRAFEQASCQSDTECATGLFCDAGAEGGLCRKRFAQGASCTAASEQSIATACAEGLVCKGFRFAKTGATPGTCVTLGQIGAACVASAQVTGCAEGLSCNGGFCADKPTSGACAAPEDCKDGVAYCDGSQCKPLKGVGDACATSEECESRSCDPSAGKCASSDPSCHEP